MTNITRLISLGALLSLRSLFIGLNSIVLPLTLLWSALSGLCLVMALSSTGSNLGRTLTWRHHVCIGILRRQYFILQRKALFQRIRSCLIRPMVDWYYPLIRTTRYWLL